MDLPPDRSRGDLRLPCPRRTEVIRERATLPRAPIDDRVMGRARRVPGLLAEAGHHRVAKPVDLVIAAAAQASGLTVLHYDADYERVAAVTHRPTEWIAPAGSLDR